MNPVLFLDIDGVLNRHNKTPSGYCGIDADLRNNLNLVVDAVQNLTLVIHSAWRYCILNGDMSINGFSIMLATHGIKALNHGRPIVVGYTDYDDLTLKGSEADRVDKIRANVAKSGCTNYAIVDDMNLDCENFFHCPNGLTAEIAVKLIEHFSNYEKE